MSLETFHDQGHAIKPGTVTSWAGSLGNIPPGWVLCDGNNGTKNLLDRSVKGIPNAQTDPGDSGGKRTKTISTSQLPSHGHTGSTGTLGTAHQHSWDHFNPGGIGDENWHGSGSNHTMETSGGTHSHSISTGATGGGSSMNNMPPYIETAFIMKV